MDLHRRAIRIVHARLGLVSNNRELHAVRVLHRPRAPVPLDGLPSRRRRAPGTARPRVDAEIRISRRAGARARDRARARPGARRGRLTALEAANTDWRYSLFKPLASVATVIHALERHHDTWSFHASAMVDDKGISAYPGGAGAARRCSCWRVDPRLDHLLDRDDPPPDRRRLRVLPRAPSSTNIRLGTLLYDFPAVLERLGPCCRRRRIRGVEDRPRPSARADTVGRAGEPVPPHQSARRSSPAGPRASSRCSTVGRSSSSFLRHATEKHGQHRPSLRPAGRPRRLRHAGADGPAAPRDAWT